jgi:hypothetical protein
MRVFPEIFCATQVHRLGGDVQRAENLVLGFLNCKGGIRTVNRCRVSSLSIQIQERSFGLDGIQFCNLIFFVALQSFGYEDPGCQRITVACLVETLAMSEVSEQTFDELVDNAMDYLHELHKKRNSASH